MWAKLQHDKLKFCYCQISNISHTIAKLLITQVQLEHRLSALLQLHIRSRLNTWLQWIGQRQRQDETRNIKVWGFGATYNRDLMVHVYVSSSLRWRQVEMNPETNELSLRTQSYSLQHTIYYTRHLGSHEDSHWLTISWLFLWNITSFHVLKQHKKLQKLGFYYYIVYQWLKKRCNSSVLAMELCLFCIKLSIWQYKCYTIIRAMRKCKKKT